MRSFNRTMAAGAALAATAAAPAGALTINTGFFLNTPGIPQLAQPASAVGGGNLQDLASKAAAVWVAALGDYGAETVINLGVAWADTPAAGASPNNLAGTFEGVAGPATIGGTWGRGILFNAKRNDWFLDDTPYDASEFGARSTSSVAFGGEMLETSDSFLASAGSIAFGKTDAFTVMLHEIGHAIGFADYDSSPFDAGSTTIDAPLPFAGYVTPLTAVNGGHISTPFASALLYPFIGASRRSVASELDLITVADIVGYRVKDLDAPDKIAGVLASSEQVAAVPLPGTALLTVAGLAGLAGAARRRRA